MLFCTLVFNVTSCIQRQRRYLRAIQSLCLDCKSFASSFNKDRGNTYLRSAETTCCGDTPQDNSYKSSWAEFYAENRLRFILRQSEKSNGKDDKLHHLVITTIDKVVPRLIGDKHLNGGKGVTPVVTHGDLWAGNAGKGSIGGQGEPENVVFDPSAAYAHSEYDLGIMNMFGGFGSSFFREYHQLCPKTEPVEEYEDRVALYELYHHLNHHALFGGGYRSGAVSIMQRLISKYGKDKSEL